MPAEGWIHDEAIKLCGCDECDAGGAAYTCRRDDYVRAIRKGLEMAASIFNGYTDNGAAIRKLHDVMAEGRPRGERPERERDE